MGHKHAVVTVADPSESGKAYSILREVRVSATEVAYYCRGDQIGRGRTRWVTVLDADSDAQRNTKCINALNA